MQKELAIFGALLVYALTGCTVGPKYHPPVTQAAPGFKESPANFHDNGPWTVAQPQDAKLRGDWWTIFNEPELNALEGQLNVNNQNIKLAFDNFMQARTLVGEARAAYYPTLGTIPSFTRSRSSGNLSNASAANTGKQSQIYSLPFEASWEPDLWGKVRNEVHAAQFAAQVSAADLVNEQLTEQAALAAFFFEIRGQDALLDVFTKTIQQDTQSLNLTQSLYNTGISDYISVVQAQNALESAQATQTNLGILRAQYEHAIAVLIGKSPSQFSMPTRPISAVPPPIPIGVPSLLLERRPDIAAAEREMASANANIGVAYSAFYPNLTLNASGGTEASAISHLLDWPSRFWSLGPSISQPLFQAGLSSALHQRVTIYNADLDTYRQTVLTAFQQVEDDMAATRLLSKQIVQQEQAVAYSQKALDLEVIRYQTGLDPYIDVITLQNTLLSNQQTLATLHTTGMTSAVALVEALGGGWDRSQLPTPAQVTQTPPKVDTSIHN